MAHCLWAAIGITLCATRIILAIGYQDTEAVGLSMPAGATLVGATRDHFVGDANDATLCVGSEMRFYMRYGALMRAMAAADIQTNLRNDRSKPYPRYTDGPNTHLAVV